MAKLDREARRRERRDDKQARKVARRDAAAAPLQPDVPDTETAGEAAPPAVSITGHTP